MNPDTSPPRVVYLLGAGATQACVSSVGSPHRILMRDLGEPLNEKLQELVSNDFSADTGLRNLVNSVIDDSTDFEHIITFLDDAPSLRHRQFAEEMRKAFEEVLRERLDRIREETQGDALNLYKVLLDMYNIKQCPESLQGIITINYDDYMEDAIEQVSKVPVDFGIRVDPGSGQRDGVKLLKLHGSFGWRNTLPISRGSNGDATLWIPPGIHKTKQAYPFNVLWGLAREMLSCDVLRVVGCRLGANDWDLISLLFTMRHVNVADRPQIEVIDAPQHVQELKEEYPYLELLSIVEVEPIGSRLITGFTGWSPKPFTAFDDGEQQEIIGLAGKDRNWFEDWLNAKLEYFDMELGDVSTDNGFAKHFLEA